MFMKTAYLTCVFKVHNPSSRKRTVIDYAFAEYERAYWNMLEYAQKNLDEIRQDGVYQSVRGDKYTSKSISSLIPRPIVPLHGSVKDSLIQDVAANIASYLELEKTDKRTNFPTFKVRDIPDYESSLDYFGTCGSEVKDYDDGRNALLRRAHDKVMPLYFSRPDGATRNRNFSLLWNTEKRQLLAGLWLLPRGHELCRPINVKQGNLIRLDTGEIFKSNSATAVLVPLELGRNGWQEEKFIKPSLDHLISVKSAFLSKRDGEYFLHVSFAFEVPKAYKPQSYIGIDKGILFTAAYSLIDANGGMLTLGHFDDELRSLQIRHGKEREYRAKSGRMVTKLHYKRKAYEAILHGLANRIIKMAQENQAQIVVEDLGIQVKGSRVVSRFRKLDRFLEYKCKMLGIPFRKVFAAYSSMICHKCGEMMKRNNRAVTCQCGYVGHSDDNAAVNIARRALYKKKQWQDRGGYKAFHKSFRRIDG